MRSADEDGPAPVGRDRMGEKARAENCQGSSLGDQIAMGIWLGCPQPKIIS